MIFQVIIDFLHELAAVAWIGGIIYANLVLMPSVSAIQVQEQGKLIGAVTKRFTMLSWLSIFVLIGTGILKALSPEMKNISQTEHLMLSIKYALFAGMFIVSVLITFVLGPKMKKLASQPGQQPAPELGKVQKQIGTLAIINMILGVLVLLVMAIK